MDDASAKFLLIDVFGIASILHEFSATQCLGASMACSNISFTASAWMNIGVLGLLNWGKVFRGDRRGIAGVGAFGDVLGAL